MWSAVVCWLPTVWILRGGGGVTEMGQVVKVSSSHFNKHTVPNQITTFKKKKKNMNRFSAIFFASSLPTSVQV